MLLVTRVDSRRVLVLGAAGLVPAALVTLLLVHQPSIGARPLYPMLRSTLTLLGFGLALATLIAWVSTPNRISRLSLSGVAWAGVTVLLCIGPFVESTPRDRLFALQLDTGRVAWATSRAAVAPVVVGDFLVVTEVDAAAYVGLDPNTGRQRWRHEIEGTETPEAVAVSTAETEVTRSPESDEAPPSAPASTSAAEIAVVDGHLEAAGTAEREPWSLELAGEAVLTVVQSGDSAFAYVSTPAARGAPAGAIVKVDADDGQVRWRRALPPSVAASGGTPAIDADGNTVVVAGGERIAALDADDGELRWTQSVVALGKSRGYALPGAVQDVMIWDSLVFLSATPDA
jgi:PQQ-like domain